MNNPKVSVILPVYNCEKYLQYAIESILDQTFKDFELLILDDGSTDKSSEIAKKYAAKDNRIRYFYHSNMGLAKTLNKGLKLARGVYIARQDADDISHPERLEKQVKYLDGHPEIALVGTSMYQIDEKGKKLYFYKFPTSHNKIIKLLEKGENPFPHTSIMIRKSVINMIGGYRELFKKAQDYDLYLRVCERFKVASIPEPLVQVRFHEESISRSERFFETRMYALYALACYQFKKKEKNDPCNENTFQRFTRKYSNSLCRKYIILRHDYMKRHKLTKVVPKLDFSLLKLTFLKFTTNIEIKFIYKWIERKK